MQKFGEAIGIFYFIFKRGLRLSVKNAYTESNFDM